MTYTSSNAPSIIVEHWALDAALKRYWRENPEIDGDPLGTLPQYHRNRVVNLAIQIESEGGHGEI